MSKYQYMRIFVDIERGDPLLEELIDLIGEMSVGRMDWDFEDLKDSEIDDGEVCDE